jgi:hypothetical protein
MPKNVRVVLPLKRYFLFLAFLFVSLPGWAQMPVQGRAPAVPLITHSPYFSIWSASDELTSVNTSHWTGKEQRLSGLVRVDGKTYRYMGAEPSEIPPMQQDSLRVTPLRTEYGLEASGIRLTATFFTPALPGDLDVLARPVTYLTWTVSSIDQKAHSVAILLDVSPTIAVNTADQEVTWGRAKTSGLEIASVGSRDQQVLHRAGDDVRIDWGYFYAAVPGADQATLALSHEAMKSFIDSGTLPADDDLDMRVSMPSWKSGAGTSTRP